MTTGTYYIDAKGRTAISKDAGATLDYLFDWTDFLVPIGDSIASVSGSAVGVTLVGPPTFTGNVVTFWATGGTVGESASVTITITTASSPPRIAPMTVQFKITPKVT